MERSTRQRQMDMFGGGSNQFRLVLEMAEFKALLHDLKIAVKGAKPGQVRVSFEGGRVSFQVQGAVVTAAAVGQWPGVARFPVPLLRAIIKVPFSGGSVILKYEEGRFFLNNTSALAAWEDISPPPINIPLNATLTEILLLRHLYSPWQIISSGLMPQLEAAELKATDKIRNAVRPLKELGVDEKDLAEWIIGRFKKTAARRLRQKNK